MRGRHARGSDGDVAIIGGSASGLYCALELARAGRDVRVYERARALDPSPRTLIVTRRYRDLLGELGERSIVNEIRRFELFADGRVAQVSLRRPDLIVERSTLIRHLAERAEAAGAQILPGRRFVGVQQNGTGLTLHTSQRNNDGVEESHAGIVIGADGAFSKVARAAGWAPQPTVPLIQAIVARPRDLPRDTTRVWFAPQSTPYFFWLIPESSDRAALGMIGVDGSANRQILEEFLQHRHLDVIEYQAARVPLYTRWVPVHRQLGNGHVYLVGDAAGQVKVTTVGGLVTGLRGARAVARSIRDGDSSRELRSLRRELDLHLLVRRALHRFTQDDYCRLIDVTDVSLRDALDAHTRDEAFKLLLRLGRTQPRLFLLGVRRALGSGSLIEGAFMQPAG